MGNYMTSFKLHVMKHVKQFEYTDSAGMTEAMIKQSVARLTSRTALAIPEETYEWLTNYVRYVRDKDQLFVYDNTTGVWHFEQSDAFLANLLTDVFSYMAEYALSKNDQVMHRYAQWFYNTANRIPQIAKRLKTAVAFSVPTSASLTSQTEHYRYFKTETGNALLDMSKPTFNLTMTRMKQTQGMMLQHIAPMPMSVTDEDPTLWLKLIDDYMLNDPDRVAYFKKILAYLMSPYNYNQVLIYFIGESGRNGKSTVIKVLQDILGPHAIRMNSELLNAKPNPSFKKDDALAATEGRSVLFFNEIDERMLASTQNIKDLTEGGRDEFGNKVMTVVRPAYSRNYEVNVHGIPVVIANSLINFGSWTNFDPIFKRLILVPFDFHITKEDPTLLTRLAKEYPLIQSWLYRNYFEHKHINLKTLVKPQDVLDKVKDYRDESDIIQTFLSECLDHGPGLRLRRSDLHKMFVEYCKVQGSHPIKNNGPNGFAALTKAFREHKGEQNSGGTVYIKGVAASAYYEKEIIG